MSAIDILVVGGGPAGVAAALAAAREGLAVALAEQKGSLGGALFARPAAGARPVPMPGRQRARWQALATKLDRLPVDIRLRHGFAGIDSAGLAILEDRAAGAIAALRPRGIILAIGAVETVIPRPGWELPRVLTAGGLQVMMKQSGRLPPGRIVLAGSGPLLVATAAQMAALGRPPAAVLEAGDPLRPSGAALSLLRHPGYAADAAGYLARLAAAGVRWRHRHEVVSVISRDDGLVLTVRGPAGDAALPADWLALHDGLLPNGFGLPAGGDGIGPAVMRAGDCREVLGGMAAIADGMRAGTQMAAMLAGHGGTAEADPPALVRHRDAQAILSRLFGRPPPDLAALPDRTVVCRCEGRTVGDLRTLLREQKAPLSAREVKLNGRFAMGACQGRFCADWTARLIGEINGAPPPPAGEITGNRWPGRPVPVSAFVAGAPPASAEPTEEPMQTDGAHVPASPAARRGGPEW